MHLYDVIIQTASRSGNLRWRDLWKRENADQAGRSAGGLLEFVEVIKFLKLLSGVLSGGAGERGIDARKMVISLRLSQ